METVTDIFKSIGQRLGNPFIFSFIIAWCIYNWEIPIALFWYDPEELKAEGFSSVYDLIIRTACKWDSWKTPIVYASAYTLAAPLVYYIIKLFNTFISKYGDILNFKISEGGTVAVEKYHKLETKNTELYKTLADKIRSAGTFETQFKEEVTKNEELKNQLSTNQKLIGDLNKLAENDRQSVMMLNGHWIYTNTKFPQGMIVEIKDSEIWETNPSKIATRKAYEIKNFIIRGNKVFFNKLDMDTMVFVPAEFEFSDGIMTGKEYIGREGIEASYQRTEGRIPSAGKKSGGSNAF